MKHIYKFSLFIAFLVILYPFMTVSAAVTPTFALANSNSNIVSISVSADPNASVLLYYYPNNSSNTSSTNIGTTDGSGNMNTTLNANNYNIQPGSMVYIVVNGQQSQTRTWPNYSNNNYGGSVYLSQNSININSLGNASVYINGGSSNGYYISSNSNSSVVSAYVSGNTINLSANSSSGSSTIVVCSNSSGSSCSTLYVTVNNNSGYNGNPITINPSNISLGIGQNANVNIYGGNNYYYLSSGSNSYIVNTTISGNTINLYGRNPGSETLVVCSSNIGSGNNYNYSSCANLYVTVGNTYYSGNNNVNYYSTPTVGTSVSGVFLSQIPYTGVAENLKMIFFILGMMIWSGFMAYTFMMKKGMLQPAGHGAVSMRERIEEFKKENLRRKRE